MRDKLTQGTGRAYPGEEPEKENLETEPQNVMDLIGVLSEYALSKAIESNDLGWANILLQAGGIELELMRLRAVLGGEEEA